MRKLLLSALLLSSGLLGAIEAPSVKSHDASVMLQLDTPDIQMKKDPFKKQREKDEKNRKKNPQPQIIGLSSFISAVANLNENQQSVAFDEAIVFNTTYSQNGSLAIDNETGVITASASGVYEITFGVKWTSVDPESIVALRVNGTVVPESRLSSTQDWSTVTLIVNATANPSNTFEVINDSFLPPSSDITLAGDESGNVTSAFITIKKIN